MHNYDDDDFFFGESIKKEEKERPIRRSVRNALNYSLIVT